MTSLEHAQSALVHLIWGDGMADAAREAALIQAGMAPVGRHGVLRGFSAYREHAKALSVRVLSAAFPRLEAVLGPNDFSGLAWAFARRHPPGCGDLNVWGAELPVFLASLPGMTDDLPALAQLDWALQACGLDADERPAGDLADQLRVGDDEPVRLSMHLRRFHLPLVAWPAAVVGGAPEWGECHPDALVWREHGRPCWAGLPRSWAAWLDDLAYGMALGAALRRQAMGCSSFDARCALQTALARGWIVGTGPALESGAR
ncbi:HvfC/BufC family peptide modification chaperone [Inhella gelatinilytica]|uniref:DNA-binding domain-containing protein n=1 Tax=Inhella gelatinilytica TaxID=2795030 RepID=A0A931J054_9BURK|nr:putative DNA-binding domain-containing protein [Inhella gelatinilytica]MBH9552976.1 putative DNA-binding domain-containing protein [Inhella gelatinilytica]